MKVQFLDLKAPYLELKQELDEAYFRFMESGWYVLGKETEAFEEEYAHYCGTSYCVGVASGLDALHLALRAVGIESGDEIIVPANTYIATWLAVNYAGGKPVPVEPDIRTYNIDPSLIEVAITSRTKVIMPVHLYGQPAEMDPIMEIADKHGLIVIADNAQAQGAKYKGRRTGSLAHITAHSFYPGKNFGAFGEGGAITTNNDIFADKIRVLRNYGSREKYHNEIKGFNSRIDELQAAFLRVKLRYLDKWNERRRECAKMYLKELAKCSDLILPYHQEWIEPVWHLFVIRHPERDGLQKKLNKNEIGTLIHYPVPPHLSGAYSDMGWRKGSFPISEKLAETVLSLPMGPHLKEYQIEKIVKNINV